MDQRAQSVMEYALFVAVVAAALIAMSTYVQRSIQANLKSVEDQINAEAIMAAPSASKSPTTTPTRPTGPTTPTTTGTGTGTRPAPGSTTTTTTGTGTRPAPSTPTTPTRTGTR